MTTTNTLTWKARFIITQDGAVVDLPHDRQQVVGLPDGTTPDGAAARVEFLNKLAEAMPPTILFDIIRNKLRSGEIKTREAGEVVILDDSEGEGWYIAADSKASAGYLYVEARRWRRLNAEGD